MPTNALPIPPLPLQQRVVEQRLLLTVPWVMLWRWVLGVIAAPTYAEGTHEERVGDPADPDDKGMPASTFRPGAFYQETDRTVLYQAAWDPDGDPAWVYVSGTMYDVLANKPADLEANDIGFLFHGIDFDHTWRWGALAAYTDLVIGSTTTQLTSAAHPFTAAHVGRVLNITGGTGFTVDRYVVVSVAGSTATVDRAVGTASSIEGEGILSGWQYAPGDRISGEIAWFTEAAGTGWALCNGAAVTRTTAVAGTASFTTPNLIGAYAKGGATYTGAVVPAVPVTVTATLAPAGGHAHTVPTFVTDANGASVNVQAYSSGTAAAVCPVNHGHYVSANPATTTNGSHTHTFDSLSASGGEPAHVDLLPYYRL